VELEALHTNTTQAVNLERAQALAQRVAERVQHQAHKQLATLVTRCIALFDEPYTFRITFTRARGRTEAHLNFRRDGVEVDPIEAAGLGVVDVAALALRVTSLLLSQGRRVLILDEPLKWVSERGDYRERCRALLEALARELQVQFILVTHDPLLTCGKVVDLG
jgi:hypothetical protein